MGGHCQQSPATNAIGGIEGNQRVWVSHLNIVQRIRRFLDTATHSMEQTFSLSLALGKHSNRIAQPEGNLSGPRPVLGGQR